MPADSPDVLPPISVGAWTRVGSVFQSASDPNKVNDWHMDTAYVELHAGGKIHKKVGVTLNLNGNMVAFPNASARRDGRIGSTVGDHGRDHLVRLHGRVPPVGRPPAGPGRPRERVRPVLHDPWNYPGS
jgi:hypothetical protein